MMNARKLKAEAAKSELASQLQQQATAAPSPSSSAAADPRKKSAVTR